MVIERMSRGGYPPRDIADTLEKHQRTIEWELKRGHVMYKDTEWREHTLDSSDRGQDVHDLNATEKGPRLKMGATHKLAKFVSSRIVAYKESPDVVAFRMRAAQMDGAVCTKTLYSYIEQGLIPNVSSETLWQKRKRRNRPRRSRKHHQKRESIENRSAHVEKREEFGHWEIDLVVSPTRG